MKKRNLTWMIVVPAVVSLILTLSCYYYWNARFTFGFGDMAMRASSAFKDLLFEQEKFDDVIAINVSYDRTLEPYADEYGIPVGVIDITDRSKLLAFMDSLSAWNNYKYIVCDIDMSGFSTPYDETLFSRMAVMRDIVASGSDMEAVPQKLKGIVASSDYDQLLSGDGFLKYNYFTSDGYETMAYRMWKDLDGGSINKHWWGYTSGKRLAVCSLIPDLKFITRSDWSSDGEKNVYNLGADILSVPESFRLFEGKIVLIGDFREYDNHDTIKNEVAGTAIIYNAYLALKNGDHTVKLLVLILLFLVFGAEISFALRKYWYIKKEDDEEDKKERSLSSKLASSLLEAVLSWIGYAGVMAVVCFFIYVFFGFFVNAIIIGSLIAFVSPFVDPEEQ